MLALGSIKAGMSASLDFAGRLVEDLDSSLWDSSDPATDDVRDYMVGAARAVAANLQNASVHLKYYGELRYAQDAEMGQLSRSTGRPFPIPGTNPRFDEREAQLDAAEQGLFVAAGASLDCLAAVLAGVAGLRTPIQRVDYGMLTPLRVAGARTEVDYDRRLLRALSPAHTDLGQLQLGAVAALGAAVDASGPAGWLLWAFGVRNMSVHREHRMELISTARSTRRGRMVVDRLGPANPDQSHMAALKTAEYELAQFYIHEDLGTTLKGVMSSLSTTVVGTVAVLGNLWAERKARPELTVSASAQWKPVSAYQVFKGYEPGPMGISSEKSALIMHPSDARRMKAGGLIKPVR
ncbi:hypothetical protein E3O19_08790 [Cryobacterium algoritolerans]|uniref:Uncharacterized protein n=1 Tax=Cryobacterium algoritolerans TaxID=1259184 RepID=A0A4R8WS89_9MICO|nr:hypothetical protein [Cryobacterium algoritolerans]TFC15216.1 hypothetical protein E3O19_08790 [Cryobacterium algoritolerans]